MAAAVPPPGFSTSSLVLHREAPGSRTYGRIFASRYPDPLGVGKTPSRFSDSRPLPDDERFAVLYLGSTFDVCFLEAVLRDQRVGTIGTLPLAEDDLEARNYATIRVAEQLNLVDLRDNGTVRMGIPTDVPRGSDQTLARQWAVALHGHDAKVDGIIYPSRLNGETNIAVFDRAIPKLSMVENRPLIGAAELARVLDAFDVALV